MKKIIITLSAILFSVSLFAVIPKTVPTGDPIKKTTFLQDDLNQFDDELEGLQSLENLVSETNVTATELKETNNDLLHFFDKDASIENSILAMAAPGDERPLGIGGFIWGFCLGLIGVVIVYVAIDDPELKKREGRNAIYGCLVSTLLSVAIQLLIFSSQQ